MFAAAKGQNISDLPEGVLAACAGEIRDVIRVAPEFSLPHVWLAEIHSRLGNVDQAKKEYAIAADLVSVCSESEATRLLAQSVSADEREQIVAEIISECDATFFGTLDMSAFAPGSDFRTMANAISDASSNESAAISLVAHRRGYSNDLVEAIWCARDDS